MTSSDSRDSGGKVLSHCPADEAEAEPSFSRVEAWGPDAGSKAQLSLHPLCSQA